MKYVVKLNVYKKKKKMQITVNRTHLLEINIRGHIKMINNHCKCVRLQQLQERKESKDARGDSDKDAQRLAK